MISKQVMRADVGWLSKALILVLILEISGCRSVTLRSGFEPVDSTTSSISSERISTLVVATGEDARPLGGRSSVGSGFLAWIPLVPYGHQIFSPEHPGLAASLQTESLLSDVVNVVVRDLQSAGVADRVVKKGLELRNLGDSGAAARSHELRITLDEGIYNRNLTMYGVSLAGALLWFVGLPNSYGNAELAVTAELLDPDGRSLGTQSFSGKSSATEWLYRPIGPAYSKAMPRAYGTISPRLREFIADRLSE